MTMTVSVSQLRSNISSYLEQVLKGVRVLIRDEKKNITIAQITQTHTFDKNMYEKALHKAAGVFSLENHPYWRTKATLTAWLRNNRLSNERSF